MRNVLSLAALLIFGLSGTAAAAPTVIWNTAYQSTISSADTVGGNGKDLFSGPAVPEVQVLNGTTVDPSTGKVFWANTAAVADEIYSGDLNDTSRTPCLVSGSEENPIGVTYNPSNETLYWANLSIDPSIRFAKAPSDCSPAVASTLYKQSDYSAAINTPSSVAVDPARKKIYWSNYLNGNIGFGNLDGSGNVGTITLSGCSLVRAFSVNLDPAENRLYVGARFSGGAEGLAFADLDGNNCQSVVLGGEIWGTTRDSETLFAGNWELGQISVWPMSAFPEGGSLFAPGGTATLTEAEQPAVIDVPGGTSTVSPSEATVGAELVCSVDWDAGSPGIQYYRAPQGATSYSWSRDGQVLTGETSRTLRAELAGEYLCTATASNYAGKGTATASAKVEGPPPPPGPTPTPSPTPPPAPSNEFSLRTPLVAGSTIRTVVRIPGPGVLGQLGSFRSRGSSRGACSSSRRTFSRAGLYRVRCPLTEVVRAARRKGSVRVRLVTTYTPTGGTARAKVQTVILRSLKPRFTG